MSKAWGKETVEPVALAIQEADEHASGAAEDCALGMDEDVSDWGAYLAKFAIRKLVELGWGPAQ